MKVDRSSLLLYAVTDRSRLGGCSLADRVEKAIKSGATLVQLREKELPFSEFLREAKEIKKITDSCRVPLIINDNIRVALACDAAGIHIGQDDLDVSAARALLGKDKTIGVSAQTVEEAVIAEQQGADYLGVGTVFPTSTKPDAVQVTLATLKAICSSVSIPVVAIGGINAQNLLQLQNSGIAGVAVVSAIFSQADVSAATRQLRELAQKLVTV